MLLDLWSKTFSVLSFECHDLRLKRPSQKVKLLVEGNHLPAACLASRNLLRIAATSPFTLRSRSRTPAPIADQDVELCDLVSVLARGGHLDRAGPVEVVVAESKAELLDLHLLELALVEGHEAVRRQDTALVSRGRCHEEVKRLACLSVATGMFNKPTVDDTATGWIAELTAIVLDEKSLVDTLVHHN